MTEVTTTARGFPILNFQDAYGTSCSVQCSSAIDFDAPRHENPGSSYLWIGVNDADPRIMAADAPNHGIQTDNNTGWVRYPIPKEVVMSTRMHLNREQVKMLIGNLQTWLASGTL